LLSFPKGICFLLLPIRLPFVILFEGVMLSVAKDLRICTRQFSEAMLEPE